MPTKDDFQTELHAQLRHAGGMGEPSIPIKASKLYREVGGDPGSNHRMPVCCDAMRGEKPMTMKSYILLPRAEAQDSKFATDCRGGRAMTAAKAALAFAASLALAFPAFAGATEDLLRAVKEGAVSEVEAALEAGANPDARDEDGYTPLHWAASGNSPGAAKLLLEVGVDPSARDLTGKTPFDYAKERGILQGTEAYWLLNDGQFE